MHIPCVFEMSVTFDDEAIVQQLYGSLNAEKYPKYAFLSSSCHVEIPLIRQIHKHILYSGF